MSLMRLMAFLTTFICLFSTATENWNLDAIYETESEWQAAVADIKQRLTEIRQLEKKQITNANDLLTVLKEVRQVRGAVGKLAKVGLLQHFTDTTNQAFISRKEQSEFMEIQVEGAVSFMGNFIKKLPQNKLEQWLKKLPELNQHQIRINRIRRLSPYQLDSRSEAVLADLGRLPRTANDFYHEVLKSNIEWPEFRNQPLTPSRYKQLNRSADANTRAASAKLFFGFISQYQDLFALSLTRRIEGDSLIAKHRGLDDSIDTLLVIQDGFEPQTYTTLFDVLRNNRKLIEEITINLAKAKGQPYLTPTDFRSMIDNGAHEYDLDYSHQLTLAAASNVSIGYRDLMEKRLKLPWMHISDSPNKSDTVGVFWQVGGGNPHTIFKFKNNYISSRLYASSAFLMMGLANIPESKSPDRREEDLPVFSNSLWYLGHLMQTDALLDLSKSTAEKQVVLSNLVTRSLNTLVNYAAMVMLEQKISLAILNGESIDTSTINQWYLSSLRELLESDTMKIDEHWQYGWMMESFAFYGPHYASFYQALTAALAIKRKIDSGDKKAIDLVENGIAKSSSFFSSDVLTQANIRLDESSTYQLALDELLLFSRKLNDFAK